MYNPERAGVYGKELISVDLDDDSVFRDLEKKAAGAFCCTTSPDRPEVDDVLSVNGRTSPEESSSAGRSKIPEADSFRPGDSER